MTIERGQGTLTCRVCGHVWVADDATASLIEELVDHAHAHDGPQPDQAKPAIWLR